MTEDSVEYNSVTPRFIIVPEMPFTRNLDKISTGESNVEYMLVSDICTNIQSKLKAR